MNELTDGRTREMTMSYSVSSLTNYDSKDFDDAKEAAKVFHAIDASDRPHVVLTKHGTEYGTGGSGQVIATTAGRGEAGAINRILEVFGQSRS